MSLFAENKNATFKRKFPRRKFNGYIGVLYRGKYKLTNSAVLGEGGLAFYLESKINIGSLIVVTFKIPGHNLVSIRGEVRNSKHETKISNLYFHGIQFFKIPIEDRRKIRSYVSARLQTEELV